MPRKALRAAATARSTSFSSPSGTRPITSPLPALCTSMVCLPDGATHAPPMKSWSAEEHCRYSSYTQVDGSEGESGALPRAQQAGGRRGDRGRRAQARRGDGEARRVRRVPFRPVGDQRHHRAAAAAGARARGRGRGRARWARASPTSRRATTSSFRSSTCAASAASASPAGRCCASSRARRSPRRSKARRACATPTGEPLNIFSGCGAMAEYATRVGREPDQDRSEDPARLRGARRLRGDDRRRRGVQHRARSSRALRSRCSAAAAWGCP